MTNSLPTVYMDACCFIDCAKTVMKTPTPKVREPHIYFCRKFLEAARNKHVTVYTSTVSVVECIKLTDDTVKGGPTIEDDNIKALFKRMLMSAKSGVMPVMPNPGITESARDLRWNHGITCSGMDRIHVATALAMNASHFLTTDGRLGHENIQKIGHLGLVVATADTVAHLLPDEYKQLHLEAKHATKQGIQA